MDANDLNGASDLQTLLAAVFPPTPMSSPWRTSEFTFPQKPQTSPDAAAPWCRYCGCTESNPCRLRDGDQCGWGDTGRTFCSRDACVKAAVRARRAVRR